MAKILLLLLFAFPAFGIGTDCPFQPNDEDKQLMDRIVTSLDAFRRTCQPRDNSALEGAIEQMQKTAQELNTSFRNETAIKKLGDWLGIPITCGNYPELISDQRDDAYRRFINGLSAPTDADYERCFREFNASEDAFMGCVDAAREEKLQVSAEACESVYTDGQRRKREALIAQSYGVLNQNLKVMFEGLGDQCLESDPEKLAEAQQSALRTGSALATAFASIEPVSSAAGLGIAMGGSALNEVLKLLKKKSPAELWAKEQMIPDLSCLLLETLERNLNCDQLLGSAPAAPAPEATPAQTALVDVLDAMGRVENRANQEKRALASTPSSTLADLSENPVLSQLTVLMHMKIPDPATGANLPMMEYLAKVSAELQAAGTHGSKTPEYDSGSVALGKVLAEVLESYQQYEAAPDLKRTEFLNKMAEIGARTIDINRPTGVPALVEKAIERHWQINLPKDSALKNFFALERARNQEEALRDRVNRNFNPAAPEAFSILKNGYGKIIEQKAASYRKELDRVMRDAKQDSAQGNGRASLANRRANTFRNFVEPLFDQCTLLAGVFMFGTTPTDINERVYEDACRPFLCEDGHGLPSFKGNALTFREHQCKLIYDHAALKRQALQDFVANGQICSTDSKTRMQRFKEFVTPKWPFKGSTHDSKSPKP